MKSPAWIAGYRAGYDVYAPASVAAMIVPDEHKSNCADFVSGYFIGSRDAHSDLVIDDLLHLAEGTPIVDDETKLHEWSYRWATHLKIHREIPGTDPETSDAEQLTKLRSKLLAGEEYPEPDFD